jgi:hypothetical protein
LPAKGVQQKQQQKQQQQQQQEQRVCVKPLKVMLAAKADGGFSMVLKLAGEHCCRARSKER